MGYSGAPWHMVLCTLRYDFLCHTFLNEPFTLKKNNFIHFDSHILGARGYANLETNLKLKLPRRCVF